MGKKKVVRLSANQRIENVRFHVDLSKNLNSSQRAEFNSQLDNASKISDGVIRRQRIAQIYSDFQDVELRNVYGRSPEEVRNELQLFGYARKKEGGVVKSIPPKKEEAPAFVIEEPEFE